MMTKQEAQAKDAQIIELSGQYIDMVGPIALEMRDREGWRALGCKTWTDYCHHVDERISAVHVMRLAQKAEVERNLGAKLPGRHALELAKLPTAEAQREVFAEVMDNYQKPVERNFQTHVERWLQKHNKPSGVRRNNSDGWTSADLENDSELAHALDRIEKVYGHADRKGLQDGAIGLSRKDIIGLSAFHATKMKEVQYLIMANHWDLATAMKFINKQPDSKTTVHELQNHCLATPCFYYTCSVNGFDHTVRAPKAITNKSKGQANGLS